MELKVLKDRIAKVEDPRRTERGNIRRKLEDIIIIGLCTFLELPNGIPDSDTFRRAFERLNPEALSEANCPVL